MSGEQASTASSRVSLPRMTEKPRTGDHHDENRDRRPGSTAREHNIEHPAANLRFAVVEYPDQPDKGTICPKNLAQDDLMVTWITADKETFVDLIDVR